MNHRLLQENFNKFIQFIKDKDGKFFSFESQPYIKKHESYKSKVNAIGYENLGVDKWAKTDIGSGKILQSVRNAIDFKENNLLIHDNRRGENSRPDKSLFKNIDDAELQVYESVIYDFYNENTTDEMSFNNIKKIAGKQYPFLAYLFFLKSKKKYLPIAPNTFDYCFNLLGIDLKTSKKCSWENYMEFLSRVNDVRAFLQLNINFKEEITLLDAHSFLWIIGSHMKDWNSTDVKFDISKEATFEKIKISKRKMLNFKESVDNNKECKDYVKIQIRNNQLGAISEDVVLNYEKQLNENVVQVSNNPSKGYDIEVLNNKNEIIKRIEVKTEGMNSSFIISPNEIKKSNKYDNYYIYVVKFPESKKPIIKCLSVRDILSDMTTEPIGYRVYF